MLKHQQWKISSMHMYPEHKYGMKTKVSDWCDYESLEENYIF